MTSSVTDYREIEAFACVANRDTLGKIQYQGIQDVRLLAVKVVDRVKKIFSCRTFH